MSEEKIPIRKLSSKGGHYVSLLLNEHCSRDGDLAVYAGGWSDALVANEAARRSGDVVTEKNVAYVRLAVFGHLRRPPAPDADVAARIDTLQRNFASRLDAIERQMQVLAAQIDRIETDLGMEPMAIANGGAHHGGH